MYNDLISDILTDIFAKLSGHFLQDRKNVMKNWFTLKKWLRLINWEISENHSPWLMIGLKANTKHLYNICTTSAQRLRRWSNIVQILYKCFVFTGLGTWIPIYIAENYCAYNKLYAIDKCKFIDIYMYLQKYILPDCHHSPSIGSMTSLMDLWATVGLVCANDSTWITTI